jgi:hypothetical protein
LQILVVFSLVILEQAHSLLLLVLLVHLQGGLLFVGAVIAGDLFFLSLFVFFEHSVGTHVVLVSNVLRQVLS